MMIEELINPVGDIVYKIKSFIDSVPNTDVKQTYEWALLRNEEKHILYAMEDEKIICYANAFEYKDEELEEKIWYVSKGPVCDESKYSIEEAIIDIVKFAKKNGIRFVKFNLSRENLNVKKIENEKMECTFIPRNAYDRLRESPREAIVDLKCENEEELLNGFHYKTRYNIRKSLRSNLDTIVSDSLELDDFYELYIEVAKRHEFHPHDKKYFEKLIKIFKNKIVFCTVKYQDETLAMSINIKQANSLFYLYGVSSEKHRNLFPCYNMHWTMMKYAIENKFELYNFGGVFSDDDDIENKDYGLLIFKSRFCKNGFREYVSDFIIKNKEK